MILVEKCGGGADSGDRRSSLELEVMGGGCRE